MVMKNKRGWLRILEVVIAIMILLGVVLTVYSRKQVDYQSSSDLVQGLQFKILDQISSDDSLRLGVLINDSSSIDLLNNFINRSFFDEGASRFDFSLLICNINDGCGLTDSIVLQKTLDKEVFVEEKIISGNLNVYSPRKVRLFVWEK